MHILPLVGGKVEEVKRRQHCLMFSSAGPQAQTYFVNFDTLADYQRWHRQASKVSVFTCQSCYVGQSVCQSFVFVFSDRLCKVSVRKHNEGLSWLVPLGWDSECTVC
ncbi:unnamed protein product [Oncorhynchus mykiss]|uniref:Uncharacterized protein n=2 Tax=Oncorhynchus mykiss TaxID=8022 RepID=A0A060XC49_ONCMY|nr:unnamed protein product [Oncorhynchus mykiss]